MNTNYICSFFLFLQKEFLSKTGGNNVRDNIHRILKKTITNECSMKCSWKGLRNNFKVSNLYLIKIIKSMLYLKVLNFLL